MKTHQQLSTAFLLVALGIGASGCRGMKSEPLKAPLKIAQKIDIPNEVPWKAKKTPKFGEPTRIVATWTDTVLQQTGKPAQRGFGGKLFFYAADPDEPVAVEGQLVVYAFDEAGRKPTDNQPTKRFVFPPQQFALHRGDTELGTAYSFWLPWDEVGGTQTDVSLIARFEPLKGGTLIVSDQSQLRLPGRLEEKLLPPRSAVAAGASVSHIHQASHVEASSLATSPKKLGLETTTINLPAGYRLRNSGSKMLKKVGASENITPSMLNPANTTGQTQTIVEPTTSQASGARTTVSYSSPGESVRRRLARPSAGSLLDRSPAPNGPAVR